MRLLSSVECEVLIRAIMKTATEWYMVACSTVEVYRKVKRKLSP
jgi:hypothetical protein